MSIEHIGEKSDCTMSCPPPYFSMNSDVMMVIFSELTTKMPKVINHYNCQILRKLNRRNNLLTCRNNYSVIEYTLHRLTNK
jgi:hypothetical protein